MTTFSFSQFAVRVDGSLNVEATTEKFQAELLAWEEQTRAERAQIGGLIHAIFDREARGTRCSEAFILSSIQGALNCSQEQFREIKTRVQDFLKSSPEFHSRVGKGGGWGRVADLV